MQLTTTDVVGATHGLKFLVHGPAGVGKTRLCATTGELDRTIILSAEAGLLSLRDYSIATIAIASMQDMRDAAGYLLSDEGTKYTWVCVDSLSELAQICLSEEMKKHDDGRAAYGEMADTMFKLIRAFRDLPGRNVVFTSKQVRIESDGRLLYAPMLPGKQLSQNISHQFDEVFAMRSQASADDSKVQRWLHTVHDGYYEAKDRSGALDASEPPNLAHIASKILTKATT